MKISGIFSRFSNRNEKTGTSGFWMKTENGSVHANGTVPPYPRHTPIVAECEPAENGYTAVSVKACGYDGDSVREFLTGGYFTGIQEATAEKIAAGVGGDIFKAVRNLKSGENLKIKGVPAPTAELMTSNIRWITDFEDLLAFVADNGGTYYNAAKIYDRYGSKSIEMIRNNPYVLLYAGAEFGLCEKMALTHGIHEFDHKRVRAVVEYAMTAERNMGNTKVDFRRLVSHISYMERQTDVSFTTSSLFIGEEVMSDRYVLEETDGMVYVYTKSDYENEVNIVNDIKRLASSAKKLKSLTPIDEAEDYCGVRYSQEQINTFDALETTGLKIITGGPGTGKTTLLNGFLWKYERDNPDSSILLCAPTGRAAMRMRESTGRDAFTVHKALGIRPFESKSFAPDTKKLDADCVVVDECSMLDEEIFCRLMGAVKNGALVLLLGDKDQLPSIGAGNVLSDLLQSGKIETYALTHIFRQNNSLIIENSRRISRGDVDIKQGSRFLIKRFQTEDDMVNYAANVGKNCKSRGVGDVKFFTPSRNRKFLSGTVNMNGRLQDMMNRSGKSVTYGCYTYYVGDKVVFNANDYEKGYYNGQEGIVTDIQEHNNMQYITIETDDGHINLTGTDMEDIELGYIMTAHKSQGSECKNAVVLIPLHPASLLKRQLLYVEVTRAKECVMILSERDALEQAISCKYEYERSTGLKEKLKKC